MKDEASVCSGEMIDSMMQLFSPHTIKSYNKLLYDNLDFLFVKYNLFQQAFVVWPKNLTTACFNHFMNKL